MDELLKEITRSKHKELLLRAEKERVRNEIEQLRAVRRQHEEGACRFEVCNAHAWMLRQGALWTREAEKQQQLLEIRREREELQLKEREEAQKLQQLNESFKQRVGAHDGLAEPHCWS